MSKRPSKTLLWILAATTAALFLKYFYTYFLFYGVPFGYDAGIYRFLFIREAAGLPPFFTPALPEWAKSHAPGLFFFSSLLLKLGMSPDLLIGWVWNLIPVGLVLTLAGVVRKKEGDLAGMFVLFCALVSTVQFAGFTMMYYKVFIALLTCTFSFYFFSKHSFWWVLFGMLTIAMHQQIGLIFVLATLSSILSQAFFSPKNQLRRDLPLWILTCVLGGLWYVPTYQRSLFDILPQVLDATTLLVAGIALAVLFVFIALLRFLPRLDRRFLWILPSALGVIVLLALPFTSEAPEFFARYMLSRSGSVSGSFLSFTEYFYLSAPLLCFGVIGLVLSTKKYKGTPEQFAAFWCGIAVVSLFFFYRRFLLPLDFFLLPFAAYTCVTLWKNKMMGRLFVSFVLLAQGGLMIAQVYAADPHVEREWLQAFSKLHESIPAGSTVVVMDSLAPWVLGYLPDAEVSGPGIFDSRPYDEWEKFLLGSESDRTVFLTQYPLGTYFYASELFRAYYPPSVLSVLDHPCLESLPMRGLFKIRCIADGAP
jgi:hypothetical protein